MLISLLSALCYVILYFKIPIPSPVGNPFLHMGNMLVMLFALIFGGPISGVAGAVGMGLFDLMNGYHLYAPKTIILKFLMGITCGIVFGVANKTLSDKVNKIIITIGVIFAVIGASVAYLCQATGGVIYIVSVDKQIVLSPILYIGSFVLAVIMFGCYVIAKNKNSEYKCALFACTSALLVNIIGEFFLGAIQYVIMTGTPLSASMILSATSLPATLLNGVVSIIVAVNLHHILKNRTDALQNWQNR